MPVAKHPTDQKEAWLFDWLQRPENHGKTTDQIRQAMRDEFKEVLGTARLNNAIKEAKAMSTLRARKGGSEGKEHQNGRVPQEEDASDLPVAVTPAVTATPRRNGMSPRDTVAVLKQAMESAGIQAIRLGVDGQVDVTYKMG